MDANHKLKMSKFTGLKRVFDGLRSSVSTPPRFENEVEETLRTDHFQVCKTVRHGFPYQPTAVAFDPVQHLLAIGTKTGSLRILGRPGVDVHCSHDGETTVIQILFINNDGALISVCSDDSLHLWNFRQKRPEIVHTLKFQRERITFCHLPFRSKWLYIGTERGNVHIANIESFVLSGYVINWNKAIELSRKTHPGPVVHLSDCPMDTNKLLIGFETGAIVLWDLKSKTADYRYSSPEALRSVCWHHEGKQFMCSHTDGSLTTYSIKQAPKPISVMMPHAKMGKEGKPDPCKPITKVEWRSTKNGEALVIFSGGMSYDRAGRTPSITVMNGKSTTVLEMEHNVVDFVVLCETPWPNEIQEPYAIVVLLQNDLVVVDLTSPGYPCFENPYPMDIHESPVTSCQYYADCPHDLIPAFYSVGSKQKRTGFSEKSWPIKGGTWGTTTCSYPEIIITGHADGSMKFWDASSVTLQVLYKLKTAKMFEKPKPLKTPDGQEDDPLAIYHIHLCLESRTMCAAGATHLMLFKFSKQEMSIEVMNMNISIMYDEFDDMDSPECEYPTSSSKPSLGVVSQHGGSMGSYSSNTSEHSVKIETGTSLKVRGGSKKFSSGFYPDLVCLLNWLDNEHPGNISSISLNSSYGLLAFGNESGLAIVDYIQRACLLTLGSPGLYGSMDPYQRAPRSPRGKKFPQNCDNSCAEDGCRSPNNDQSSPQMSPNISPKRSTKKKSSHPDLGLSAIQELSQSWEQHADLDLCAITKPDKVMHQVSVESGCSSSRSASVEPHEESEEEDSMVKELRMFAAKHNEKEQVSEQSEKNKTQNLSPNKSSLHTGNKLPLCKTVSDPSRGKMHVEFLESVPSLNRDRASSTPEVDSLDNAGEAPKDHKHRRLSLKSFKIKRKKNHAKSPACPEESSGEVGHTNTLAAEHSSNTSDKENDSDTMDPDDPHVPKQNFLRRMSVKVKTLVTGKDGDESEKHQPKLDVVDLSSDDKKASVRQMTYQDICQLKGLALPDKPEGAPFTRSRSSSMSSLENVSREAIQCLVFSDSYARKTDNFTSPCLWVGTSLGSVLVIALNLPLQPDVRSTQPVFASPSGTIFQLKGSVLTMSFLDCTGTLISSQSEQWQDAVRKDKENKEKQQQQLPRQISVAQKPKISPSSSTEICDKQYAILCSEKQARVISLPSQTCVYKARLADTCFVVRADVVSLRDSVCLSCYLDSGRITVFSLPSLKPLLDIDFLPLTHVRIARTFCFSCNGHACYLCSPTEIQKISFSADMSDNLNEMLCDLFLPCDTPEAPKTGFLKSLFGGGAAALDREELFGESSGKGSRGTAVRVQGTGGMQQLQRESGSATNEVSRAKQLFLERGEKLEKVVDSSEQMANQAENFASASHQLMLKYKDKKWYQF